MGKQYASRHGAEAVFDVTARVTSRAMSATACKFYLAGACRNGASCRFSHDADASASASARASTETRERCKFVDAPGGCTFGDRCKYAHGASDAGASDVARAFSRVTLATGAGRGMSASATAFAPGGTRGNANANGAEYEYGEEEDEDWGYVDEHGNWVSFDDEGEGAREFLAAQLPDEDELLGLTSEGPSGAGDDAWGFFDEGGNWVSLEGEGQRYLQTQEDLGIGREDSFVDDGVDESADEDAEAEDAEVARLEASQNLECVVCLEVVVEKPRFADRRFGLLNACEHCFCLNCIRGWRQGGTQRGAEASASSNEQARMCPICRTTSHFITPTTSWPRNDEEKTQMIDSYRERMGKIPCKHFDGGDGTCPFGTSCFYEHRYRATGELESAEVRKSTASDGSLNILTPVRLSDFIQTSRRFR